MVDQLVDLPAQKAGVDLISEELQLVFPFLRDRLRRAEAVEGGGCPVKAALDP